MSHGATEQLDLSQTQQRFAAVAPAVCLGGAIAAVAGFAVALGYGHFVQHDWHRILLSYLTAFCYFLSISLGALFFVVVQHLTRAGWSVVIRRIAEVIAMNVVVMAVLAVPILVAVPWLYPHWAQPHGYSDVLAHKIGWLDPTFFRFRIVLYFAIWIFIAWFHWSNSVEQDRTRDRAITLKLQGISGLWVLFIGLGFVFSSFDLIMSLDPHWYSTMFGVYFFAGSFLGFFCTTVLVCRFLQARGILNGVVTVEHYHDLGKWMLAFTFFWGYVAFSQFMLMWYGSIPEETEWFARRGATTHEPEYGAMAHWGCISVVLLLGHLFIPFGALLTRWTKRRLACLTILAVWLLVFHYIDLYWQIMPELSNSDELVQVGDQMIERYWAPHAPGLVTELAMLVGVGGFWIAGLAWLASRNALVPVGDPRLEESLAFENF